MAALGVTRCVLWRLGGRAFSRGGARALGGECAARFTDTRVQRLLRKMTGLELKKVFTARKQQLKPPEYRLMTDTQLQEAVWEAERQGAELLAMPPVLERRSPVDDTLSDDPLLQGSDTAKLVFTDIHFSTPHRNRFIVVREPSGLLRKASWEERDRMIQVYFPKEGRKITTPAVFTHENLQAAFEEDKHEDVLKFCLVQFEPDSAEFHRVHTETYEHIEKHGKYELLRSTRFFGGLVWFLTLKRRIDGLLLDTLHNKRVVDAVSLVSLFHLVHPQTPSAQEAERQEATGLQLLKIFSQQESGRSGLLDLELQRCEQEEDLSAA